jgi:N6-adenosine-specific RNA methylase IME4
VENRHVNSRSVRTPIAFIDSASDIAQDLLRLPTSHFHIALADPPWRFINKTGKVAPKHRRLFRYESMTLDEICALPVAHVTASPAHLYLWVPNALLPDGLAFTYKSNLVWHKDGGSDGRGVGFHFRHVTELLLFGLRDPTPARSLSGQTQVNLIETRKARAQQ